MKDATAGVPNPHRLRRWGDMLTGCVGTALLLIVVALVVTVLSEGVGML